MSTTAVRVVRMRCPFKIICAVCGLRQVIDLGFFWAIIVVCDLLGFIDLVLLVSGLHLILCVICLLYPSLNISCTFYTLNGAVVAPVSPLITVIPARDRLRNWV